MDNNFVFCPACGTRMNATDPFCSSCGTQNPNAAAYAQQQPAYSQPAYAQPAYEQPAYEQPAAAQPAYEQPAAPQVEAAPAVANDGSKVFAIIGMILGICSIPCACVGFLGLICGIPGIILSLIASKKASEAGNKNGMAIAGIVCSAIGLTFGLIMTIITYVACVDAQRYADLDDLYRYMY